MKRLAYYLPALAWAALIFFLSSRSSVPSIIGEIPGGDKIVHGSFYGVFALCFLYGARLPVGRTAWWCVVWVSLYGITDEIHQSFVPGRSCDPLDWFADTCGGAVFIACWLQWNKKTRSAS